MKVKGVACQTYSWEMLGDEFTGTVDDILDAVRDGGFDGIEIASSMFGEYETRPEDFAQAVAERGLVVAAVAHTSSGGWTAEGQLERDLEDAKRVIDWTARAGAGRLGLGGASGPEEADRPALLARACERYVAVGAAGSMAGVEVNVHPHSHAGSVIESEAEYEQLLGVVDGETLGWGPDVGHMMRSGVDYIAMLRRSRDVLVHLHLKDIGVDGSWAPLGAGRCDLQALVALLGRIDYRGWLVLEEEYEEARLDPAGAVARGRRTIGGYGA